MSEAKTGKPETPTTDEVVKLAHEDSRARIVKAAQESGKSQRKVLRTVVQELGMSVKDAATVVNWQNALDVLTQTGVEQGDKVGRGPRADLGEAVAFALASVGIGTAGSLRTYVLALHWQESHPADVDRIARAMLLTDGTQLSLNNAAKLRQAVTRKDSSVAIVEDTIRRVRGHGRPTWRAVESALGAVKGLDSADKRHQAIDMLYVEGGKPGGSVDQTEKSGKATEMTEEGIAAFITNAETPFSVVLETCQTAVRHLVDIVESGDHQTDEREQGAIFAMSEDLLTLVAGFAATAAEAA